MSYETATDTAQTFEELVLEPETFEELVLEPETFGEFDWEFRFEDIAL